MASFFKNVGSNISRVKEAALQKIGKSDETVDINYNKEVERFKENLKNVKRIQKDCKKLIDCMEELSKAEQILAEDFYKLFELAQSHPTFPISKQFVEVTTNIDHHRVQSSESLKNDFMDPISTYLGQFKDMDNRIDTQTGRRLDMDKYIREVRSLREKGGNPTKLQITEQKMEASKQNYTALNQELMRDLPALYEDRLKFFDPCFATYVNSMHQYYSQSASTLQPVDQQMSRVNRAAIHMHPRVTADPEESCANIRNTSAYVPENTERDPAQRKSVAPSIATSSSQSSFSTPSHPAPSPHTTQQKQATALYDFNASDPSELSFAYGDTLIIHSQEGQWWNAELRGKRGVIPSNYVQML